ncbi:MAG: YdcF family protein [Flavobacteriales bacterium]
MGKVERVVPLYRKKRFILPLVLLFLMIVLVIFKNPLMRGVGRWLAAEDMLRPTEACFVLGGNSFERGSAGYQIFLKYPSHKFVASGGNYSYQVRCLGLELEEARLTKEYMIRLGVPSTQVDTLMNSHSTMDESEEILSYCNQHGLHDITVISSVLHLRRVRGVFEDKFKEAGINICFHGASAVDYTPDNWWSSEEGLIMANNECVKLLYYWMKY